MLFICVFKGHLQFYPPPLSLPLSLLSPLLSLLPLELALPREHVLELALQPTYTIPPIGNLAIYVTRRSRGLLVLIPSIVSNQQNDHLVIVQRKSKHGHTN